jgi:putative redox protein
MRSGEFSRREEVVKATVRRIGGVAMAGKAGSGHWVTMDGPEDIGGFEGGSRPLELFLIGLGGCTGMDVLSILAKKRIKLDDFEIEVDSDRAAEHPKVFTAIRLVFHFYGDNLKLEDLQRAVALSEEKYCSASAMLRRACPIDVKVETHPPRPAR